VLLVLPAPLRPTRGCGGGGDVDDRGDETPKEPDDPDALVACVDQHSCVRVVLHGGAARADGVRNAGESISMATPAASGGDADDPRPAYRVLDLLNYQAGAHTTTVHRV